MTDLDIIDAEVVPTADDLDASMGRVEASVSSIADELVWQLTSEAWRADERYSSFSDLWADRWEPLGISVPRAVRPRAIEQMRRERLTQQQIADKLNVGVGTVNRDLAAHFPNGKSETITNARGDERPATYAKPAPEHVNTETGEINPGPTAGEMNTAAREQRQSDRTDSARFDLALSTIAGLANPQFADALRRAHSNIGTDPGIVGTRHNAETLHHLAKILDDYATTLENQP